MAETQKRTPLAPWSCTETAALVSIINPRKCYHRHEVCFVILMLYLLMCILMCAVTKVTGLLPPVTKISSDVISGLTIYKLRANERPLCGNPKGFTEFVQGFFMKRPKVFKKKSVTLPGNGQLLSVAHRLHLDMLAELFYCLAQMKPEMPYAWGWHTEVVKKKKKTDVEETVHSKLML